MIVLALYAVVCLLMARHDAQLIKHDGAVHHDRNMLYHAIAFTAGVFITLFTHSWYLLGCYPFTGRLVFDVSLNLMRGKDWFYVSPWIVAGDPRSSKIDRMEYRVFKSGKTPKIVYGITIITLITLHYVTD